ncbi:MAG: lytic transglycosylase domain-containing protein [Gemmatimonadaceae bacterium]|nr:lytic transglycosylase domain-containing protein [Gemmatimonadaceae bacterium]
MKRSLTPRKLAHQALSGIALFAIVYATASHVQPVFFGQTRVAQRVFDNGAARDSSRMIEAVIRSSPWLHAPFEVAVGSGQFAADRDAFVQDLVGTGRVTEARATRIADAAVTRAYRERVPPALILGIMLTENDLFKPTARSKVGAVGLMQIMPNVWRPTLGKIFGTDLRDDATNIKYGVFVLRWMHDGVPGELGPGASYRTALLRYNGCVSGRNTPNCRRYPDVVQRHVLRSASASCGERDFQSCVIQPLWLRRQLSAPRTLSMASVHGATGMLAD